MSKLIKRAARKVPKRAKAARVKVSAKRRAKPAPLAGVAAKARVTPQATPVAVTAAPAAEQFNLKLDASCTLRETADLQFSLVVATGDPVIIDGSGVERIDTAGLQLLVALARRQQQAGRRLEWKAASPELVKCSQRLGLSQALGLATAAPGEAK